MTGARLLADWCRTAAHDLAVAQSELDAINVYPVADADTGANMVATMNAACTALEATVPADDLATTLHRIARAALVGACGNSGVILTQLLHGAATALGGVRELTGDTLASALSAAAEAGYQAVHEPVEGTILSVARAAAEAAGAGAQEQSQTLASVSAVAVDAARDALAQTTKQLDALRAADVVDAGGAGLVIVLEALHSVVTGEPSPTSAGLTSARLGPQRHDRSDDEPADDSSAAEATSSPADEHATPEAVSSSRAYAGPAYEVIFLLEASQETVPALRTELAELGDSLVVTGGPMSEGPVSEGPVSEGPVGEGPVSEGPVSVGTVGGGEPGLWHVHVHVDDAGAAVEAGLRAGRPHQIRITYLTAAGGTPADEDHANDDPPVRQVLAVVAGHGLARLFTAAGVTVAAGGPDWELTAADLAGKIEELGGTDVIVLPNDPDGVAVAEEAAAKVRELGGRVAVVPARTQVQGLAACAVHQSGRGFDEDLVAMTAAAGHTRHGAVTVARCDVFTSLGTRRAGEVLGIIGGEVVLVGHDVADAGHQVVERLLSGGGELVTVVTGADADATLADVVVDRIRALHPELEAFAYAGGQARYPLLIGVE